MQATSVTQATVSKQPRNHHPSSEVAASRAKFAKTSKSAIVRTAASTANANPTGNSPRAFAKRQREQRERRRPPE